MQLPFSERWRMLEDEIIRPRYNEKKQFESGAKSNPLYKYDMELFSVSDSKTLELYYSIFMSPMKQIFIFLLCDATRLGGRIFGCSPQLLGCLRNLFQNFVMMLMA